jgi:predicted nuclease of predicted toxin-antitoxin system
VKPLLVDQGLPPCVADALSRLSIDAHAVGGPAPAPPKGDGDGGDDVNVDWCRTRDAILVTNDRGKKDKVIIDLLAERHVHAIFVGKELRDGPARDLAAAVLNAERETERILGHGQLIKHHLSRSGKLKKKP